MKDTNPFDLNLARAYDAPKTFCDRPDIVATLERAFASRLWTLINGDRRLGKSTSVIVTCVKSGWPILHVDLMGVSTIEDVSERFRWSMQLFLQQEARGLFRGIKGSVEAKIPGTDIGMSLSSDPASELKTWGDVILAFDKRVARRGGVLFIDELQDVLNLPNGGSAMARSLRAALQMARHITPIMAGSSEHLMSPLFDTAASPFFKSVRLRCDFKPIPYDDFVDWIARIFKSQHRELEVSATERMFQLTENVTEDLVSVCAEIWAQSSNQRTVSPADVDVAWRNVVNNAAPLFLPRVSSLPTLQSLLLRYVARNPGCQPFSEVTLRELAESRGSLNKALKRLLALELVRLEGTDRSKRVRIHDPRLAFYLRA